MAIDHQYGERFYKKEYKANDILETVREICENESFYLNPRVLLRMTDLNVDLQQLLDAIMMGEVVKHEVTKPSKWEIRIEFHYNEGSMKKYKPVVYLSKELSLYCEDIRTMDEH